MIHKTSTILVVITATTMLSRAAGAQVTDCSNDTGACIGGDNSASGGFGVYGQSTAGYGAWGVDGSYGYGVYGNSSSGAGMYGTSSSGPGVAGSSTNNYGVEGTSTDLYGVYGEGDNVSGAGVYGYSTGNVGVYGSGASYGVQGYSSANAGVYASSSSGYGMEALSSSSYGIYGTSTDEDGIHGEVDNSWSATAGVNEGTGPGIYGGSTYGYGVYGTSTTNYAGYFNGPVKITGNLSVGGSCTGCSDLRLKQNIQPLTGAGAMDQLLRLRGVTFEWKDPTKHNHERETGTQIGFIAQDVEKVFPQWVDEKGYTAPNGETFRTLDLRHIEALEVESIRQLKNENDDLKSRLSALENGRKVVVAGNAWGFAVGGLAVACALVVSRRKKKDEEEASS